MTDVLGQLLKRREAIAATVKTDPRLELAQLDQAIDAERQKAAEAAKLARMEAEHAERVSQSQAALAELAQLYPALQRLLADLQRLKKTPASGYVLGDLLSVLKRQIAQLEIAMPELAGKPPRAVYTLTETVTEARRTLERDKAELERATESLRNAQRAEVAEAVEIWQARVSELKARLEKQAAGLARLEKQLKNLQS